MRFLMRCHSAPYLSAFVIVLQTAHPIQTRQVDRAAPHHPHPIQDHGGLQDNLHDTPTHTHTPTHKTSPPRPVESGGQSSESGHESLSFSQDSVTNRKSNFCD